MDGRLEVRLLGPLEVCRDGVPLDVPRGRSRALLALLALAVGRTVPVERLVDELWGSSPPATVVTALHGLVSGLRKRLEPDPGVATAPRVLVTRPGGYLLDVPADHVDAHRFRTMVHRAAAVSGEERAALLRDALTQWRGGALTGVELAGAAISEAAALEEVRLSAYEACLDAELALGRHHEVSGEIDTLVTEHPYRERLASQLMLAHYRSGRQADALEVWRRTRRTLVEHLGVEPGPELRKLHLAILAHDPALDLEGAHPAATPSDERDRTLAARAGELLADAGTQVYDRHYDAGMAEQLFSQAERLLAPGHPQHDLVDDRLAEIDLMLGRHDGADDRLQRSLADARRTGDHRRTSHLHLERARIRLITGPDPIPMDDLGSIAARALVQARTDGDDALESQACYLLGLIELRRAQPRRMEAVARDGLIAAERSGNLRERLAARWWLALALVEGPTPTDEALAECLELAELDGEHHPGVLAEMARLHVRRGEPAAAMGSIARAQRFLERRPEMRRPIMFVAQRAGEVELAAGDSARAEVHLREALTLADGFAEADQQAQLAAGLAEILSQRGQVDQAMKLAHSSRRRAPHESIPAQVRWRSSLAAVLSASQDHAAAWSLLDEATAFVPRDATLLTADLRRRRVDLAANHEAAAAAPARPPASSAH
ncbi:AfsR/SARP family transcriptional regulator [Nitriliruptor alkaliphilus]|uniref:AfsR/SARP family transcriptional regulator n=1 Tax=Nitriliruptor alkaliphilus TaxID=427918 RepID=UPI00069795F7|nr:BTAD domain-containing putative transcriptional regulator [Nitriliruptor alkaliphilus]